jgi:uncharacterized protein involved in exopolysaccharide biosynthesis
MWSALVLASALAVPFSAATATAATLEPATPQIRATVRVYDSSHRDYHQWNRAEEARYREYLKEQHRSYVNYRRQNVKQQRAYWRWRHDHDR